MTQTSEKNEIFTGLILLTGLDKPGISNELFQTLSPFAVSVIDIDQISINERIILTVLLSLNPSHQGAVEADLAALAAELDVDIACLFSLSTPPQSGSDVIEIHVESDKIHPRALGVLTLALTSAGGCIDNLRRISLSPLSIVIRTSGVDQSQVQKAIDETIAQEGPHLKIVIART